MGGRSVGGRGACRGEVSGVREHVGEGVGGRVALCSRLQEGFGVLA